MTRPRCTLLLLLALTTTNFAVKVLRADDGICTYDFHNHYEQLTRLTSTDPAAGGDTVTMTYDAAVDADLTLRASLHETWYVAHDEEPGVTAPLFRIFRAGPPPDHADAPTSTEGATSGYVPDGLLGYPWRIAGDGLVPLQRFKNPVTGDHATWPTSTLNGYNLQVVWSTATNRPRLGYPRFGLKLDNLSVLDHAYDHNRNLDNGYMAVRFNQVWGMAIGEIVVNGENIVQRNIGSMVQSVVRYLPRGPNGLPDGDCASPNPTQSGGVRCVFQRTEPAVSERATGSPWISSGKKNRNGVFGTTTVLRPLDFCSNGGKEGLDADLWPGADLFSPLAWHGYLKREDHLGCNLGSTLAPDVLMSRARGRLTQDFVSQFGEAGRTVSLDNTYWLNAGSFGASYSQGHVSGIQVSWIDLRTGQETSVPGFDSGNKLIIPNGIEDHAIIVSSIDGTRAFALARLGVPAGTGSTTLWLRVAGGGSNVAFVVDGTDLNSFFPRTNPPTWGEPVTTYLIVNDRATVHTRLAELYQDGGDCLDP